MNIIEKYKKYKKDKARNKLDNILNKDAKEISDLENKYGVGKIKAHLVAAGAGLLLSPLLANKLRKNVIKKLKNANVTTAKGNLKSNLDALNLLENEPIIDLKTLRKQVLPSVHPDTTPRVYLPTPKGRESEINGVNLYEISRKNREEATKKVTEKIQELEKNAELGIDENQVVQQKINNLRQQIAKDKDYLKEIDLDDEGYAKYLNNRGYYSSASELFDNSPVYKKGVRNLTLGGTVGLTSVGYSVANRKKKREYNKRKLDYWENLDRYRKENFKKNINTLSSFATDEEFDEIFRRHAATGRYAADTGFGDAAKQAAKQRLIYQTLIPVGLIGGYYGLKYLTRSKKKRKLDEVDKDINNRELQRVLTEIEQENKERKQRSDKGIKRGKYNV